MKPSMNAHAQWMLKLMYNFTGKIENGWAEHADDRTQFTMDAIVNVKVVEIGPASDTNYRYHKCEVVVTSNSDKGLWIPTGQLMFIHFSVFLVGCKAEI